VSLSCPYKTELNNKGTERFLKKSRSMSYKPLQDFNALADASKEVPTIYFIKQKTFVCYRITDTILSYKKK